jgi:hypothetical protein
VTDGERFSAYSRVNTAFLSASSRQSLAGFSAREVARFASAELLRRAWFTLSSRDVFCGVQIGVATATTVRTPEVITRPSADRSTDRTPLAGIGGINLLNRDALLGRLVDDEPLKLPEGPGMDPGPRTPFTNFTEVLNSNQWLIKLVSELNETSRERMVQMCHPTLFFLTHAVECAKRTRFL